MKDRKSASFILALGMVVFGVVASNGARADSPGGSDQLGPPSVALATGTTSAIAGTGLHAGSGTINFNLPGNAKVKQVFLYWGVHATPDRKSLNATDTISVNSTSVVGTRIGGPTLFFLRKHLLRKLPRRCDEFRATGGDEHSTIASPPRTPTRTFPFRTDGLASSGSSEKQTPPPTFSPGRSGPRILFQFAPSAQ